MATTDKSAKKFVKTGVLPQATYNVEVVGADPAFRCNALNLAVRSLGKLGVQPCFASAIELNYGKHADTSPDIIFQKRQLDAWSCVWLRADGARRQSLCNVWRFSATL